MILDPTLLAAITSSLLVGGAVFVFTYVGIREGTIVRRPRGARKKHRLGKPPTAPIPLPLLGVVAPKKENDV